MIKSSNHPPDPDAYFAENHPFVENRLMLALKIIIVALTVGIFTGVFVAIQAPRDHMSAVAYWIQWFNSGALLLTVIALLFAVASLRKNKIRQAITILIVSTTVSIIAQVFANGGMGETSILIYPVMIMAAGFFGNLVLMERVKLLLTASIILLYLLGVFGVKPPDISVFDPIEVFIRIDQVIYCLLILEVCYQLVKMFIGDYGTILSRLKVEQQQSAFVVTHDTLTGLPNRFYSEQNFDKIYRHVTYTPSARKLLLFVDIDNFKNINTRFGHHGGDEALTILSSRLQQSFGNVEAVVSRIGGDEFIVMLHIPDSDVEKMLNEVLDKLAEPLIIFGQTEYVTCSIGVVEIEGVSSFKEEYRKADMAMNRAKKTGKNRYCYYNQALNDITVKNIEIGVRLYEALHKEEFVLFYQPQIDLISGEIVGAEALIRWETSDGRMISPADFIPIAEKNGSILGMTNWVINQSCKDCAYWHSQGFTDLFVSVNIPTMVLAEGDLPGFIRTTCNKVGLDPHFLELELTESVLLENGDYIQEQLQDLREMGVSLAIDDFGTGYSNLSYLSRLNVQKLKVDQYFVMNFLKSEQDRTIVQAIAHIANSFGMKTVAEGVEVAELIEPLQNLHCTMGQGYLWSRPVPLDLFLKLLSDGVNFE